MLHKIIRIAGIIRDSKEFFSRKYGRFLTWMGPFLWNEYLFFPAYLLFPTFILSIDFLFGLLYPFACLILFDLGFAAGIGPERNHF